MRFQLLVASSCLAIGCAASSDEAASSDSNYTAATPDASPGDVTPFTSADAPTSYGARVRVSFGGAPATEREETASYAGSSSSANMPWEMGVGWSATDHSVLLAFGGKGTKTFDVGTYSCADGDAVVFGAEWNADGTAKPPHLSRTCSVVIDAIVAGPSAEYARAYGRFAATASDGGLTTDVNGAFVADFPIGE